MRLPLALDGRLEGGLQVKATYFQTYLKTCSKNAPNESVNCACG